MKIAYCIHSLYRAGGMERVLCFKVNWLADIAGYEVYVITSHQKGRKPFFELSPKVHCMDLGINSNIFGRRYFKALDRMLGEIRPDISISLCGSDVYALNECGDGSVKIAEFHFMHNKFFRKYRCTAYAGFRSEKLFSRMLKYDRLVVLSGYDLIWFRALAEEKGAEPGKIQQIYNPLTIKVTKTSDLSARRFLCIGRLSPEKGFDNAVRIWKKVIVKHPDWTLDIYGEGSERKRLSELTVSEHLENSVFLKGPSTDIAKEYATASGLLMPSRYEGFPLVAIESMCFGLPTVAFDCPGGVPELISSGKNGFLVKSGDIQEAADKVCTLIENPDLRSEFSRRCLESAGQFSPSNIMSRWCSLFDSVIASRNGICG